MLALECKSEHPANHTVVGCLKKFANQNIKYIDAMKVRELESYGRHENPNRTDLEQELRADQC